MLIAMAGLVLFAVLLPYTLTADKCMGDTMAISNARQIGLALYDFESEYGKFPDESTIAEVKKRTGTTWNLKAETSNDLFKQLFVTGIEPFGQNFYLKVEGSKHPDYSKDDETNVLRNGTCAFGYIPGSTNLDAARPVLVTPIIPGTFRFDSKPFKGKAVILRTDNSAVSYPLDDSGRALTSDGRDVFDPSQPWWQGKLPDVKWPDLPVPPARPPLPKPHSEWWIAGPVLGGMVLCAMTILGSFVVLITGRPLPGKSRSEAKVIS